MSRIFTRYDLLKPTVFGAVGGGLGVVAFLILKGGDAQSLGLIAFGLRCGQAAGAGAILGSLLGYLILYILSAFRSGGSAWRRYLPPAVLLLVAGCCLGAWHSHEKKVAQRRAMGAVRTMAANVADVPFYLDSIGTVIVKEPHDEGDSGPAPINGGLQPIDVVFTLPRQTLPDVKDALARGRPVVLALPRNGDGSQVLDRGNLTLLDNPIDQITGNFRLKTEFANSNRTFWPGQFVNLRVVLKIDQGVTTVPIAAVLRDPSGTYLYVVDGDSTAHRRNVALAYRDKTVAVVSNGVKPGEIVVTEGAERVTDGADLSP